MNHPAVIVGHPTDAHVQAVLRHAPRDAVLLDAAQLSRSSFEFREDGLRANSGDGWVSVGVDDRARGWMRRIAPNDWQDGTTIGSLASIETTAWLSLLGAFARSPGVEWLSELDDTLIAENKLHQLSVARREGVRIPRTISTNSRERLRSYLPGSRVVKPLGPGSFRDTEGARVMFAQVVTDRDLEGLEGGAPLLFQEQLQAQSHLRVVTVRGRTWVCRLNALGIDLDWRATEQAHDSFEATSPPEDVAIGAIKVARALRLGFSSQDWIETSDGAYLVDVNPGGQWMFLPTEVGDEVAHEIGEWLHGR